MKRTIFLTLLFVLVIGGEQSRAQSRASVMAAQTMVKDGVAHSVAEDTAAFRKYLDNTFANHYAPTLYMMTYQRMQKARAAKEAGHPEVGKLSFGAGGWSVDNPFYPDSLRVYVRALSRLYYRSNDLEAEKAQLVHNLQAFDTASCRKPIFFIDIKQRYKGNIVKYVDALYKKSMLINLHRLWSFNRFPSEKKLRRDLGIHFLLGIVFYEVWIRDVREGRVKAECRE